MKHLRVLGVFALALAIFAGPALAETQTVKVSGSLDVMWLYREDFDLRQGNSQGVVNMAGTVLDNDVASTADSTDDGADWWMSIAQIEVAADLTDNVSVVINLFNQRDWNADQFASIGAGGGGANTTEEFDVGVDLAYVQLKEAFYAPLTLVIGRQDVEFGRGFIIGNFQTQDPQASIIADEYSAVTSFDAVRATLDFDPWTIDLVALNPVSGQGNANEEDDRYVWWLNVNYQFSEYNAEWEGYFGRDHDRATNEGTAAPAVRSFSVDETNVIGTRAQFDPVENMTLGAELAYQWGDRYASSATTSPKQDREAWAFNIFGEYTWTDNAYTPWLGLEYVFLSGDETTTADNFEGWNGLFRSPTYGVIREYLDTTYQTALSTESGTTGPVATTNHQHFSIAGGLSPMDDLSLDATYYWFWTDETHVAGTQRLDDEVGTELDVNIIYDYTEDVTFSLGLAWFWPGDLYDSYSVPDSNDGGVNDTATSVTGGVGVVF